MDQNIRSLAVRSLLGNFWRAVSISLARINLCGIFVAILFILNMPDVARGQECIGGIPANQTDSLALVALYNATGGSSWSYPVTDKTWLQRPVRDWLGVILFNCRVWSLSLNGMNLVGTLPNDLGNLTAVKSISINGQSGENGDLHGPIPSILGTLNNLETLSLVNNNLSGEIPEELGELANLIVLSLSGNRLEGPIPQELGNATNLKGLNLSQNQLTGAIPTELGNLMNATSIQLDNNKLTGTVPQSFASFNNLQTLRLQDNQLEDLPDLTSLSALTTLWLQNNRFTFEDLEPNVPLFTQAQVLYSPQDSVETHIDHAWRVLYVNVGGTQTAYQWYENDMLIPGATQSTYAATESQMYRCRTTNPLLPSLVIWSKNVVAKFKNFQIQAELVRNEIRLAGDLTAIKVSIIDEETKEVATEFGGNAIYRILDTLGVQGVGQRLSATLSLIENGVAQDVFYESTKDSFNINKPITLKTELSGPVFVEVSLENSALPPDTVRIELKSPLDFFVERIELQQGIVDIDKEVTLLYRPGENKTFPALPLVAEHNTVLLAHVGYELKTPIAFSKIEGIAGIIAKLRITRGSTFLGTFDSFRFPSRELTPFILKDPKEYDLNEQAELRDVLVALIPRELVETPANDYTFDVELEFELGLDEMASDKVNNVGVITVPFVATKPLRVLARVARWTDQAEAPEVEPEVWDFMRSAFPLQWLKLTFNNANRTVYEDTNPSLDKLAQMLAVYNKENINAQRHRLVIFTTSNEMITTVCHQPAGGCTYVNHTALIVLPDAKRLVHEMGHTFGLRDTYKSMNYVTRDGDPNPRRSDDPVGNLVESGNIPLADIEEVRQNKIARAINENGVSLVYEFMGGNEMFGGWVDRVTWDYLYRTHFEASQRGNLLAANTAAGFINVTGLVDTNNVVSLNPFVLMPVVPEISTTQTGVYALDFTDAGGASLQSFAFDIEFHIPDVGDVASVPFSFNLPLPDGTKKIAFLKNGVELGSRIFSENSPTVEITSPASGQTLNQSTLITWTASDVDGEPLTYDILFSVDGQEHEVVAVNITETSYLLRRSQVQESGAATLTVIATDGINEGRAVLRDLIVSVAQQEKPVSPAQFILRQNYPNPFNPETQIRYDLPKSTHVRLDIFNILGQRVKVLVDEQKLAGAYSLIWDGRTDNSETATSGVYIYRLKTDEFVKSRKLLLLR